MLRTCTSTRMRVWVRRSSELCATGHQASDDGLTDRRAGPTATQPDRALDGPITDSDQQQPTTSDPRPATSGQPGGTETARCYLSSPLDCTLSL